MSATNRQLFAQLAVIGVLVALSASSPRVSAQQPAAGNIESEQIVARMVSRNQERARAPDVDGNGLGLPGDSS